MTISQRGDYKRRNELHGDEPHLMSGFIHILNNCDIRKDQNILADEPDYSAIEARHRVIKIIAIAVITVIALTALVGFTSNVIEPAKAVLVQEFPDTLVSPEFAKYMMTNGHGKEFGIEDVQ